MGVEKAVTTSEALYNRPCPITARHRVTSFSCGHPGMDAWLREHALENEARASRTYVVTDRGDTVVAYYSLAASRLELADLPRRMRHNNPSFVPGILLGRLAVDSEHSGHGIGSHLLKEAMLRTAEVAGVVGVRVLLVHAIDDDAVRFYMRYGFIKSPSSPYSLILPIETIKATVAGN